MGVNVKIMRHSKFLATATTIMIVLGSSSGESRTYSYKETAVPERVKLTPRLQSMFNKTKILCFGRYAIEVPYEAQFVAGSFALPSDIVTVTGGLDEAKIRIAERIRKLKSEEPTSEITYNGPGPTENSWQIRYFEDKYKKERNALFFDTYVSKDKVTFILGDSVSQNDSESTVINRQLVRAKYLQLRAIDEVPTESGFCVDKGFIPNNTYDLQEIVSIGIYLPSLPDVAFSVGSNKDAYADYEKSRFEQMKRDELPLLARIMHAQNIQGASYPHRDVLREGKRDVQHWKGEESLIRRSDGTHDFEWAFVGTPGDVANPSEFHAAMFTKVEHNMVGAAKKASVTDDEAIAIWDKFLSALKFRVKVPGAPEDSYYFPKPQADTTDQK